MLETTGREQDRRKEPQHGLSESLLPFRNFITVLFSEMEDIVPGSMIGTDLLKLRLAVNTTFPAVRGSPVLLLFFSRWGIRLVSNRPPEVHADALEEMEV
jgi:hypothetical protein